MVLDPIPQILPVQFFGSQPQAPTSGYTCINRDSFSRYDGDSESVCESVRKAEYRLRYSALHYMSTTRHVTKAEPSHRAREIWWACEVVGLVACGGGEGRRKQGANKQMHTQKKVHTQEESQPQFRWGLSEATHSHKMDSFFETAHRI